MPNVSIPTKAKKKVASMPMRGFNGSHTEEAVGVKVAASMVPGRVLLRVLQDQLLHYLEKKLASGPDGPTPPLLCAHGLA